MPPRLSRLSAIQVLASLLLGGCASIDRLAITTLSPLDWNGQSRIELPLTLDSVGRPTVPGRIMGHDTMMLIDSGGGWPLMTPALATTTGARPDGSTLLNGRTYATASAVPVQLGTGFIELHKVAIGEQTAETQFALGPELFLQAVVDMDFDAGRMTLIRPGAYVPPPGNAVPVQLNSAKPTVQLRVNGHAQTVCAILDTGFNAGVALSAAALDQFAVARIGGHTTLNGPGGAQWSGSRLASPHEVGFSDRRYSDVPVSEKKSDVEWSCPNLLGMAVLSRHHLVFDLQHRRMWLLPRSGGIISSR